MELSALDAFVFVLHAVLFVHIFVITLTGPERQMTFELSTRENQSFCFCTGGWHGPQVLL